MKLIDFIKKIIRDYLIIFSIIVMAMTILRQISSPNNYFELKDMFVYMISALVGALPGFIFYSSKDMTEKEMKFRIIVHFLVLEMTLLVWGNIINLVNSTLETIVFAVQIAIIYILVRYFAWMDDKKDAKKINEKLKEIKDDLGIE